MADETQTAWAAGLFEGEGCISFKKNGTSDKRYPRMSMRMTDLDVMERFADIIGVGYLSCPRHATSPSGDAAKDYTEWAVTRKEDILLVLKAFLPYFGQRRSALAVEAVDALSDIKGFKPYNLAGREAAKEVTV